jgi:hypothetical protein
VSPSADANPRTRRHNVRRALFICESGDRLNGPSRANPCRPSGDAGSPRRKGTRRSVGDRSLDGKDSVRTPPCFGRPTGRRQASTERNRASSGRPSSVSPASGCSAELVAWRRACSVTTNILHATTRHRERQVSAKWPASGCSSSVLHAASVLFAGPRAASSPLLHPPGVPYDIVDPVFRFGCWLTLSPDSRFVLGNTGSRSARASLPAGALPIGRQTRQERQFPPAHSSSDGRR